MYALSNVDDSQLAAIRKLEEDTGTTLIAFSELPVKPQRLTREKLARIRGLEEELDVVLVAVDE